MPRKIVVHAGFHKTGTSTVQAVLRANRKALMPALAIRLKGQMQELMSATRGYFTYGTPDALDKVSRRFDALLDDLPGMQLDFADYCAQYPTASDLAAVVSELRRRVPAPVHSYALEDCSDLRLGPADPVLDLCDIPDDIRSTLIAQPPQNTRLDEDTLAALLEINRAHRDTDARNAAKAELLGKGPDT